MEYEKLKKSLLEIKSKIDEEVKTKKNSSNLLKYEIELRTLGREMEYLQLKDQDKEFIEFNYYSAKTYVLLSKNYKNKAIISFFEALYHYIKYINSITKPDFEKWNLDYYRLMSLHIGKSGIELFGNTDRNTIQEILDAFKKVLSISSNHYSFKLSVDKLLCNFLFSLVSDSSEIYTQEHSETAQQIEDTTSIFIKNDSSINGTLESLKFILEKRKLHYYLRQLVPPKKKEDVKNAVIQCIKNMKKIAQDEINFFKNIHDDIGNSSNFKKFLAEIDKLSSEYYESLWIKRDIIDTFKKLEIIFSAIRNNWQKITTPNIFSHFVQEFVFLSNYFKLLLLKRDFEEFGRSLAKKEWQKEVTIKVGESLNEIASRFFKYKIPSSLERKLLVVEKASSGKFTEFIVFYILREIVLNSIELKNINEISQNQDIRDFLSIINKVENISQIQWNYKVRGEASDIDILISGKYGIFLKTGILNSEDKSKIFKEIELSKSLNLEKIYQIIDIAKNLDTTKNLIKYPNVTLFDVGEFLTVLLKIAYSNKKIALELSKSSILSWAGFYSGG
ncbi:MAG: hypothetical protein WBI96_01700 [Candidatus Hydrothermia bacterium]